MRRYSERVDGDKLNDQPQNQPGPPHQPSPEDLAKSQSFARAGTGGLILVGMLLFLLWIPIMKTGEFSVVASDACIVFAMLFGALAITVYCFYRAVKLRMPERDDLVCRTCGYDLRGNVSGVCPECGGEAPNRA